MVGIGAISSWMLVLTVWRLYFDYWFYPRVKDAYIYPEWRYRVFGLALLLWCGTGITAALALFRNLVLHREAGPVTYRATVAFFILFAVLSSRRHRRQLRQRSGLLGRAPAPLRVNWREHVSNRRRIPISGVTYDNGCYRHLGAPPVKAPRSVQKHLTQKRINMI
jgi:hypothetical protein